MQSGVQHSQYRAAVQPDAPRDEELVFAAKAGSKEAFERLQNRYWPYLYRRVVLITRNREDAEDALQDAFLNAYMALGKFEGRAKFSSWLTQIATNSALMILRKRRVRGDRSSGQTFESSDDIVVDVQDAALNPEQIFDQRQRCAAVLRAIQRLDPKLQMLIRMRVVEECSLNEAARTLNASAAAAKSRLHRARRLLRRSLERRDRTASAAEREGRLHGTSCAQVIKCAFSPGSDLEEEL